ncbi:MAG: hypothetical protein HGA45_18155 [Chloroflexales bacterium]|nr:hypothetical protein [Chloroflexales bacterium]
MPQFFMRKLAEPPYVPAAGLYYYTEAAGQLCEQVLGFAGAPEPAPRRRIPLALLLGLPPDHSEIPAQHWALAVPVDPGAPRAYLATCPLDRRSGGARSLIARRNDRLIRLDPGVGALDHAAYALPQNLRASLACLLHQRREMGYTKVLTMAQDGAIANPHFRSNALPFLQSLSDVSELLIQRIDAGLRTPLADSDRAFANPDLVFQLSRVLSEGFIEGYAWKRIIEPGGFPRRQDSLEAWAAAIDQASQEAVRLSFDSLTAQEKAIFTVLREQFMLGEDFPLARIPARSHSLLTRLMADLAVMATPGDEAQTIVFWDMHYPHWFSDMRYALHQLSCQGLSLEECDRAAIAEVIMEAYARTGNDRFIRWTRAISPHLGKPTVYNIMTYLVNLAERPAPA